MTHLSPDRATLPPDAPLSPDELRHDRAIAVMTYGPSSVALGKHAADARALARARWQTDPLPLIADADELRRDAKEQERRALAEAAEASDESRPEEDRYQSAYEALAHAARAGRLAGLADRMDADTSAEQSARRHAEQEHARARIDQHEDR